MYSFKAKPEPVMHLEFIKKFEDKWALIFLIVIPIIEIIRVLLVKYGKSRLLQLIETRWYNVILPPMDTTNNKSMLSLKSLRFCGRRRPEFDFIADDVAEDIELGLKSSLLTPSLSSPRKNNTEKNKTKINLDSFNTYDAFKIISTITMFIDHYGYFGLPGLNRTQSSWFRVIGRTAAPGFFFLSGYSSKKFRIKTWFAALFLYICTSVIPLHIVHSPWESIMNILLINCIFYYIPPHRIKNPLIHVLLFMVLQYYRKYASVTLNIGYGTLPIMLAIGGDLIKYKHYMGKVWIIFAMISFGYSSNEVFAVNKSHSTAIICESVLNALMMMFFTVIEIPIFNKTVITRFGRDGLKWLSRNGLLVYCGHLCIFRLVQLAYYSGHFNHMFY